VRFANRPGNPQRQTMPNDLHYFMFFVGRLCQGAEMMIRHSEYIEADENNLMYDFVAAREATREALKEVREFLAQTTSRAGSDDQKNF
jgi:hypothetical protein